MFKREGRQPLPGSEPKRGGPAIEIDRDQSIVVTLLLRPKAPLPLPERLSQPLTHAELLEMHGPLEQDFFEVVLFALHFNLSIHSSALDRRIVRLHGSLRAFEEAFATQMVGEMQRDSIALRHTTPIMLPSEIFGIVTGVFGLDQRSIARPHFRVPPKSGPVATKPDGFDGVQLSSIYNFPVATGEGQVIAVIELGGGFTQSDLNTFFGTLNLSPPKVQAISVLGGTNSPGVNAGADMEVALDIEVAGAVAPASSVFVYFANNTDQGFLEAVSAAVHDTVNKPDIISISWGAAESQWSGQMMTAMSEVFQAAAALGISVFVAAGDDGANDNVNDGLANVDFPASSPYVTACGGTTLTITGGVRVEIAWNSSLEGGGASGGGISNVFAIPSFQQGISLPANLNGGGSGRGLPDVSAVADPYTPYAVYVAGSWAGVGGTSAVGPLFAGLLARINQLTSKRSGLINAAIYAAAAPHGFNDITIGNNSADGITGYNAGPSWDAVTGFGSPQGTNLLEILSQPSANS